MKRGDPHDALPAYRRVVAVCAHPDDESFGLGAIISSFVERGAAVDLVRLTRGEASTLHADACPLDAVRDAELAMACTELGIGRVEHAALPDGALDGVDPGRLHDVIRPFSEGADALLVFDEGGVTGHRDHQAATRAAVGVADDLDVDVLAWTVPAAVAAALNREFGSALVGRDAVEIDAWIGVDRERQRRAMACHNSQLADNRFPNRRLDLTGDVEGLRYLRGMPTRPGPAS